MTNAVYLVCVIQPINEAVIIDSIWSTLEQAKGRVAHLEQMNCFAHFNIQAWSVDEAVG